MRRHFVFHAVASFLLAMVHLSIAHAAEPVLCFTDLASGPRAGNSDTSQGQAAGQDGAIVTVWGRNLGSSQADSKVYAGNAEARVYCWSNATEPADLFSRLGMQMICFQISHAAQDGPGEIQVLVNGRKSNALPFTVRAGSICFVKTTGDNAGSGDWASAWKSIPHAVSHIAPGDVVYVCDGVRQATLDGYNKLDFRNNIIVSTGQPYVSGWSDRVIPKASGPNLWFGAGAPPAWDPTAIAAAPRFVDADHGDFHLQATSPALSAGVQEDFTADLGVTNRTEPP